jgi:tRNA(fMet)-specific endonuclease VapC
MIAALAITHGLDPVAGNTSHYQRLQPLSYPLTLVNRRM